MNKHELSKILSEYTLNNNKVEIKNPSIEELMIYLEKNKNQLDFKYHQRNEKLI